MSHKDFWHPLRYHPVQNELWNYRGKFAAVVAGRGSGKTELARRRVVMSLAVKKPWPNPIYFYALPTYPQAKRVAWKPILDLVPIHWIKGYDPRKHNEETNKESLAGVNISDSCITTRFGSTLYIMGMDKPQRIEGIQTDGGVIDECSDQRPNVFKLSVLPTLTHRKAWCWRIGVPKRTGVGRIEFREFFDRGLKVKDGIKSFYWKSSEIIDPKELEVYRANMTLEDYEEQYEALWLDAGGSIFHAFSSENIDDSVTYNPDLPLLVGCDFNVDPMAWVIGQKHGEVLHMIDELFLKNTNTQKSLDELYLRYEDHTAGWRFIGDASSRARKTSAVETDYIIIKNDDRFKNKKVNFPPKNPKLRNRFAVTNAALKNAKGERRILVGTRCVHLIQDLQLMSYQEGTTIPEDYQGTDIGHAADGFGYLCYRIFPMKSGPGASPVIHTI